MKKYQIILADPAWTISQMANIPSGRPKSRPYKSMRQVEIFELPIGEIADENCILFLWATSPLLPEALHTMKCWGFDFKTVGFTWVKKNKKSDSWFWGMGWWTRSNPEFCLIGIKGHPKRQAKNVHSVLDSRVEEHSKKPDCVRDKIVALCGELPRIELFARQKTEGWDVWGNEVESDIALSSLDINPK